MTPVKTHRHVDLSAGALERMRRRLRVRGVRAARRREVVVLRVYRD